MTTKDILFIVLSVSALVLTAFLAYFLYYLIAIVRNLRQTSRIIHDKVNEVGQALHSIKERIGDSVSTLTLLTQVVSKLVAGWRNRRSDRPRRTSKESE